MQVCSPQGWKNSDSSLYEFFFQTKSYIDAAKVTNTCFQWIFFSHTNFQKSYHYFFKKIISLYFVLHPLFVEQAEPVKVPWAKLDEGRIGGSQTPHPTFVKSNMRQTPLPLTKKFWILARVLSSPYILFDFNSTSIAKDLLCMCTHF